MTDQTSAPAQGPIRVLLLFPASPGPALLSQLRDVDDRIDVVACSYIEPTHIRTARNKGEEVRYPSDEDLPEDLRAALAGAHVVLALDLPGRLAELAPELRWVQGIGAGVGHMRTVGLPEGVLVTTAAGVGAPAIAEFVFGRLLAIWKRFDQIAQLQADHNWDPLAVRGRSLVGMTMGVVGFGAIGTAVAERARAFGMRVLGVRRHPSPHPLAEQIVGPDGLLDVLAESDAVVLCAPATPETKSLFDKEAFAAMPSGAVFCNVARGSLVDEDALMQALSTERLRAAVIDVATAEPLPPESPLWDAPNLYISPHASAVIEDYETPLFGLFEDNLRRWLSGEPVKNIADLELGY